jgi:hypothetical protein
MIVNQPDSRGCKIKRENIQKYNENIFARIKNVPYICTRF